jgi:hypothetical protein
MNRLAPACFFLIMLFTSGCALFTNSTSSKITESEKDGFRGMKWGTPVEEMEPELTFVGWDEAKQLEWYEKENEDLSLGGATLESIHYVFYQGVLKRVAIVARGPGNHELLRQHFLESFGDATGSTDRSLTWELDKTLVLFAHNPDTDVSLLILQEN